MDLRYLNSQTWQVFVRPSVANLSGLNNTRATLQVFELPGFDRLEHLYYNGHRARMMGVRLVGKTGALGRALPAIAASSTPPHVDWCRLKTSQHRGR
jgi:hypothetical protein